MKHPHFYSYLEIVKERKMEIIKIVRRERKFAGNINDYLGRFGASYT